MNTRNVNLFGLFLVAYCLLLVFIIVSTVTTFNSTGVLNIVSNDKDANIVITQPNHQAIQVGIGSTKLRLRPGSYQVLALDLGKQANSVATVSKSHTTNITLGPPESVTLPELKDTNFSGFNNLINYGMPSSQLNGLEMALFKFSPSTRYISLNSSSINFAPYNSSDSSTLSTVDFTVQIGDSAYSAVCTYDNLGSYLDLKLYSPSSTTQIYDSGT